MTVSTEQVLDFLGRPGDSTLSGSVEQAIPIVTTMVKSYTRNKGFDSGGYMTEPDLDAVVITATARLVTNPGQLITEEGAGPFNRSLRSAFVGWTLAELAVLNRYRVTAQ